MLERMSGPLCDALLERTGSAEVLRRLERSNLFVVPLDTRGEWYRYHHLLRDMLRARLERREPGVIPVLNRRAAAWLEAAGAPEEAIPYAQAAGDTDVSPGSSVPSRFAAYYSGRAATARRWIGWFDDRSHRALSGARGAGGLGSRAHGGAPRRPCAGRTRPNDRRWTGRCRTAARRRPDGSR